MKKRCLLVLALYLFIMSPSWACSCFEPPQDFCSSVNPDLYILSAKVIKKYEVGEPGGWQIPMMDVQVLEYLHQDLGVDTIAIIGQDGVNCNAGIWEFVVGDVLIMALFDYGNWFYPFPEPNNYLKRDLFGCGLYHLRVVNDVVTGNITPILNQQSYGEFVGNLDVCFNISSTSNLTGGDLKLLPNPTSGNVFLPAELIYETLEVYDMTGALLQRRPFDAEYGRQIDLSALAPGVYIITIRKDGKTYTGKVVKT